ncbi:MAG TPA: signal peptidase II [Gemmatimonadaceae bacterium]
MKSKAAVFWPLVSLLVLADCTTKQVAAERLEPEHVPHEVLGDVVRFTLAYNPGASFSVSLGEHSRWILAALAFGVLGVLMVQYLRAAAHDRMLALALGFVVAGACGNLLDRLRRPRGVVDFIDIGFGDVRFWTFNLADVAVFCGAVLLAHLLIRRDRDEGLISSPPAPST